LVRPMITTVGRFIIKIKIQNSNIKSQNYTRLPRPTSLWRSQGGRAYACCNLL